MVVGGRTILADYFPFFLSAVPIEMTNVDNDFKMTVMSEDNLPLQGVVSLTLIPKTDDVIDYIQASAGDMKNIFGQIDDIIYEDAKREARRYPGELLAKESERISGPLREKIEKVFDQHSFGVKILKIQAKFDLTEDVLKRLKEKALETFDRRAELEEYRTQLEAAAMIQTRYMNDPNMKDRVPTFDQCLREVKNLRLIRDHKYIKIDSPKGVNLVNTGLDASGGK